MCDADPYLGKINSPLFPKILIVLMLISTPLLFIPFFIHFFLWTDRSYKSPRWKKLHRVAFWLAVVVNLILWLPMFAKNLISKKP